MSNIEEMLEKKGVYVGKTAGNSMEPMLREGRDRVVIVKPKFPLKKYDVPLYRRNNHFTLHRIVKVTKNGYVICGDNRFDMERDITDKDIIGVLSGFYRGEKFFSCSDKEYISYARRVCRTRFFRHLRAYVKKRLAGIRKRNT